jgi:hypothetical protein
MKTKLLAVTLLSLSSLATAGEREYFYSERVPSGTSREAIIEYNMAFHRERANQREMDELRFNYELEREREMRRQEEFNYVETWRERDCDEYIILNRHSNYYKRDCR